MDEQNQPKLFGQGGLVFDPSNPYDYLLAVPGLGLLGQAGKYGLKYAPKAFDYAKKTLYSPKVTAGPNPGILKGTEGPLYGVINNPITKTIAGNPINTLANTAALGIYSSSKLPENQSNQQSFPQQANVLNVPQNNMLQAFQDVNVLPDENTQQTVDNINMNAMDFAQQQDLSSLPSPDISPLPNQTMVNNVSSNNFNLEKSRNLGNMLLALSDVLKGQDPSAGVLARQQLFQEEESSRQQVEMLKRAGLSDEAINLFLAGGSVEDAVNYDKEIKSQEPIDDEFEIEEVLAEAEQLTDEEFQNLSLMKEAYGGGDYIENALLSVINPFVSFDTDTRKAIAQKENFLERLRNLYTKDYEGRPAVYTQQRINQILPTSSYMSETDAYNSYKAIEGDLKRAEKDLMREAQRSQYTPKEKQKILTELRQTRSMLSKLEIVTNALAPEEDLKTRAVYKTGSPEEAESIFFGD